MRSRCLILAVAFMLACPGVFGQDLVILHTNDTHSQIEPIRLGDVEGMGGIHRRMEYFQQVKKEHKNVLILDAGDFDEGTPYYNMFGGKLEVNMMNELGYDVACLGNHEFSAGLESLANRLSKAKFAVVCANYDFSSTPLAGYVKPYTIVKKGKYKIGIFGLTLNVAATEGYMDPVMVADKTAAFLKEKKHCDLVIALTHLGYSAQNPNQVTDLVLGRNTSGIDIIIGGHSHTFLKEASSVINEKGVEVPIVQAGCSGAYVGRFDINFK